MEIRYTAIPAPRLEAMRDAGKDEFGNKWQLRVAEGWEPLRCCLRKAAVDEDIALICYAPWDSPSPWMEAGPVFVHYEACSGYPATTEYPELFRHNKAILNPFDHTGARAYDHITFLDREDDHEAALTEVLSQPEVAFVHVRSRKAGCFHFLAE
ncbi:DUF1203 domain-containing protein [Kibdelosporangium philippinense]|uniref:DUF1203 domain-containing protein n=1 Tax=Kibdelosporangium philippinense TaxID=211113 RepID=A0ABS8ZN40_9PSEU|nr:DUF1203 domain-containing protein [Kibdelosporangium philippinense]MCE7007878.1 DUF1203 domain-containing protein [Kibdelosporangium philippinense]